MSFIQTKRPYCSCYIIHLFTYLWWLLKALSTVRMSIYTSTNNDMISEQCMANDTQGSALRLISGTTSTPQICQEGPRAITKDLSLHSRSGGRIWTSDIRNTNNQWPGMFDSFYYVNSSGVAYVNINLWRTWTRALSDACEHNLVSAACEHSPTQLQPLHHTSSLPKTRQTRYRFQHARSHKHNQRRGCRCSAKADSLIYGL